MVYKEELNRKIIIRYKAVTNAANDKDFIINSSTSLMKVPKVGERLNIGKTQYTVENVTTNLNMPNPTTHDNYKMDEFDGVSYYIKLTREINNESKDKKKDMERESDKHVDEPVVDTPPNNTDTPDITSNNTIEFNSDDMRDIKQNLEKIKSILSTTLTELDMKELKDYIKDLFNNKQPVVSHNVTVKEAIIEEDSEDDKGSKILTINKAYRLFTKKDRNTSEYTLWKFGSEGDIYSVIRGIKVKTKEVKEGKIYCNNSYLCALDKVASYSCNKYIGYEYNDIYIILSELENHLKQDGTIGLKDTIFEDNINYSVEDLIKFSILYPECVHIKTTIGESKHSNTSMIINQFIRNK